MGRKLTLDFIKEEYNKKGYEFLDDVYKGALYKYNIKCHCGHEWKQRYSSLKQGQGCPKCFKEKQTLTSTFIKEEYAKKGYRFLDDFYKNAHHPHNIKCHCGYEWKQKYNSFQQGQSCPKCSGNAKHTLEFIKQEYAKRNYEFLDDYYENANHKHNIKCLTCNREWGQAYGSFQQGQGCPGCNGGLKLTLEFIKEEYSKRNYEFLDDYYENNRYRHNIKCHCGNEWKQNYGSLQKGIGCPKCAKVNRKKTCLEKYGCENPNQNPEIALKNARSQKNTYIRYHFLTNQELVCQGSWEAKVVDFLNISKINYLWQPQTFTLSTGKTYRPDLYLVDLDLWVEIKGIFRDIAKEKWDEFYTQIQTNSELWDKTKLIKLGINLNNKLDNPPQL